jgi:hypothetical protein
MQNSVVACDVFLVYDHEAIEVARRVSQTLCSFELEVFIEPAASMDQSQTEDEVWGALAESFAVVAILTGPRLSAWMMFVLGAAQAWKKPTYVVTEGLIEPVESPALKAAQAFPSTRLDDLGRAILRGKDPISADEVEQIKAVYSDARLSVDEMLLHPEKVSIFVNGVNSSNARQLTYEQVMRTLLRLRKQGSLMQTMIGVPTGSDLRE